MYCQLLWEAEVRELKVLGPLREFPFWVTGENLPFKIKVTFTKGLSYISVA